MRVRVVIFLIAVVPCLPLIFALLYWIQEHSTCLQNVRQGDREEWHGLPGQLKSDRILNKERDPFSKYQLAGTDSVDFHMLQLSEHPDIEIRGKFQQKRISEMCRKHFFSRQQGLPVNENQRIYFRHLMFDDERKAIFCFVPKIGCTNLKRLMLYMGGRLPMNTIDWPWVEDNVYLEPALNRVSFLNKTLSMGEKIYRFRNYFKFMIVRNPLERLVSGYRNKLELPVSYTRWDKFPDRVKVEILREYRSAEFTYWQQEPKKNNISVTFPEYIRYIIETDVMSMNEHFRPAFDICNPCLARFNFYGNFRNISSDVAQLIKKFQTEQRFYRDESLHTTQDQTHRKLLHYYKRLTYRDKIRLVGKLYDDLLFYYTLYPSQRHSHNHLLGINLSILPL